MKGREKHVKIGRKRKREKKGRKEGIKKEVEMKEIGEVGS